MAYFASECKRLHLLPKKKPHEQVIQAVLLEKDVFQMNNTLLFEGLETILLEKISRSEHAF